MISLFRYPGGKTRLADKILTFAPTSFDTYVEPFVGAGSTLFKVLSANKCRTVAINDADSALISLYHAIVYDLPSLCQAVENFVPSVDQFYSFKNKLKSLPSGLDCLDYEWGFMRLALHQMSYSGLGVMAGTPIGGKNQHGKYKIDCRWNPKQRIHILKKANLILRSIPCLEISCKGYADFFTELNQHKKLYKSAWMYVDPPYFHKGQELYQFSFSEGDHLTLSSCIEFLVKQGLSCSVSYDFCSEVKALYPESVFNLNLLPTKYSIEQAGSKILPGNYEYLITSP